MPNGRNAFPIRGYDEGYGAPRLDRLTQITDRVFDPRAPRRSASLQTDRLVKGLPLSPEDDATITKPHRERWRSAFCPTTCKKIRQCLGITQLSGRAQTQRHPIDNDCLGSACRKDRIGQTAESQNRPDQPGIDRSRRQHDLDLASPPWLPTARSVGTMSTSRRPGQNRSNAGSTIAMTGRITSNTVVASARRA